MKAFECMFCFINHVDNQYALIKEIFVQQVVCSMNIRYDDEVDSKDHQMDHNYMRPLLEQSNHQQLWKINFNKKKTNSTSSLSYHSPKYAHHIRNKHHQHLQLPDTNSEQHCLQLECWTSIRFKLYFLNRIQFLPMNFWYNHLKISTFLFENIRISTRSIFTNNLRQR